MDDWQIEVRGRVTLVTFGGDHVNNTFPIAKMNGLADLFRDLAKDSHLQAVVLTAGTRRSFGVGGDFNEVHQFTGGDEVTEWIQACVGMYRAALEIPAPVV